MKTLLVLVLLALGGCAAYSYEELTDMSLECSRGTVYEDITCAEIEKRAIAIEISRSKKRACEEQKYVLEQTCFINDLVMMCNTRSCKSPMDLAGCGCISPEQFRNLY